MLVTGRTIYVSTDVDTYDDQSKDVQEVERGGLQRAVVEIENTARYLITYADNVKLFFSEL